MIKLTVGINFPVLYYLVLAVKRVITFSRLEGSINEDFQGTAGRNDFMIVLKNITKYVKAE
jgi:hypothetical protein